MIEQKNRRIRTHLPLKNCWMWFFQEGYATIHWGEEMGEKPS